MIRKDKYGRGSAAANGEGFVDLAPGDTFAALAAVEINQDAKSRSTPRGAISEDLNSAPFQDLASQLRGMISYYVGDVNRTHSKFIGRDEMFSTERTVELLERIVQDSCAKRQAPSTRHQAPKFSIIIPVYNDAPYLRECLDSVLVQTFTDWEAICIDDGSADGCETILDEYAAKDKRFRVIHQKNAGVSAARNAALGVMRGEWFLFLDGDDMFRPDALEHFAQVIDGNRCDAVLMQPYCEDLDRDEAARKTDSFKVISRMRNGTHLMTGKISANGFPFGRVYKASVFQELRFQVGIGMAEDVLFWSRAIGVPAEWLAVRGSYYYYRSRSGSASQCHDFRHYDQIVKVNLLVLRQLMAYDPTGSAVRGYWRRYRWSCEHVREAFDYWEDYTVQEQQMLLSYREDVRAICCRVPYSIRFRVIFGMHQTGSHFLSKLVMCAIRVVRAIRRRVRRALSKGEMK